MSQLLLDVVRGDDRFVFVTEEATKQKPLSDIRSVFEARSTPFMVRGDRFQREGGAVIVDEDEPGVKLADLLGALTVITIKPAAATTGSKDVTVVRGEEKRHQTVAPDATLAVLRTQLGAWMQAADRFLTTSGAEVTDTNEATVTVATLLAGKDVLTIRAAAPTGAREITVARGETKKLQRIDPAAMLAALRTALGSWMAESDRFTTKSGAEVSRDDEAQISVTTALGGGDVVGVKAKGSSVTPGKPEPPVIPTHPTGGPIKWGLAAGETPKDLLAGLQQEFGKPTTSIPYVAYTELKLETKRAIFNVLQLNRGLVMKAGFETSPVLTKAYAEAITVVPVTGEVRYTIPGSSMQQITRMTTSQTVHEMRKRGVRTTKASAGAFGVALSAEYSKETEKLSINEKTTTHFLSECVIAKVGYQLNPADITASEAFSGAVDRAINSQSPSLQQYLDLLGLLDQYGHFVLSECTVGGKLMVEKEQTVSNVQEAEQVRQSFGAAVSAEVQTSKGKFSGGGGYSQTDEEATNNINRLALGAVTTTVWGGMPALTGTIAAWVDSVNNPLTWAVVSFDELTPTISYLSPALRNKCMGLIDQHYLHQETATRTVLDMHEYVAQLRATLFRNLAGV